MIRQMTRLACAPSTIAIHIGIIADTHGILRPEACTALSGCDRILHAGDIGNASVLAGLERIAPVLAVRGNVDSGPWAESLPDRATAEFSGIRILLIHNVHGLFGDPRTTDYQVVVSGHTHRPSLSTHNGILHVNPGSAGPRRFQLPVSLALLTIANGEQVASLHDLTIGRSTSEFRVEQHRPPS